MCDCLLALRLVRDFCNFVALTNLAGKWQICSAKPPPAASLRSSLSSTLSVLGQLNVVSGRSPAPQGPGVVMTVIVNNHHATCPSV